MGNMNANEAFEQAVSTLQEQHKRLADVKADETYDFNALISACFTYDEEREKWIDRGDTRAYNEMKRARHVIWLCAHKLTQREG